MVVIGKVVIVIMVSLVVGRKGSSYTSGKVFIMFAQVLYVVKISSRTHLIALFFMQSPSFGGVSNTVFNNVHSNLHFPCPANL